MLLISKNYSEPDLSRAWTGMFPAENQKNFEELFEMYKDGKINPAPSDKFTLETSAEAIAHLKDRKAKGKVVINF